MEGSDGRIDLEGEIGTAERFCRLRPLRRASTSRLSFEEKREHTLGMVDDSRRTDPRSTVVHTATQQRDPLLATY